MTKFEFLVGLKKASPIIMTCISAAAEIATPIVAIRCYNKANRVFNEMRNDPDHEYTKKDIAWAAVKAYAPVAALVGLGCFCTIKSTRDLYSVIKRASTAVEFAEIHSDNWKAAAALAASGTAMTANEALAKVKEPDIQYVPVPSEDDYRMYFDVTHHVWARMREVDFERARYMINGIYSQFGAVSAKSFYSHANALMSDKDWNGLRGWGITQTDDFISEYAEYSWFICVDSSGPKVIDEGEYQGMDYYELYWFPGTHYDEDLIWMEADCDLLRKETLGEKIFRSPKDKKDGKCYFVA